MYVTAGHYYMVGLRRVTLFLYSSPLLDNKMQTLITFRFDFRAEYARTASHISFLEDLLSVFQMHDEDLPGLDSPSKNNMQA